MPVVIDSAATNRDWSEGMSKIGPWINSTNDEIFVILSNDDAPYYQVAMYRSTDGGDTWTQSGSKQNVGSGDEQVVSISGAVADDVIHLLIATVDRIGAVEAGVLKYYEFDMATNAWQTPSLPQTIETWTDFGVYSSESMLVDIAVIDGNVILFYPKDTWDPSGSYYRHALIADTSWSSRVELAATGFSVNGLVPAADPTKVHFVGQDYRSAADGFGFAKTLDTADWSFSTLVDNSVTWNRAPAGRGVINVGNDGSSEYIFAAGSYGSSSLNPWGGIRTTEDGSGDIASGGVTKTIDSGNTTTAPGKAIILSDDANDPGYVYCIYEGNLIRRSTNYGNTWAAWDTADNTVIEAATIFTWAGTLGGATVIGCIGRDGAGANEYSEVVIDLNAVVEEKIRPVADTSGEDWDSAPTASQDLFAQVDEATPSDTDYIYTTDPNP